MKKVTYLRRPASARLLTLRTIVGAADHGRTSTSLITHTPLSGAKRAFYLLLATTLLLGSSGLARDLKTIDGDVFKNISVLAQDPTGVRIMHDDGVAALDFKKLSEADQNDFGYDPAAYADAWQEIFKAEKLRRDQAELATLQAIARVQTQIAQAKAFAQSMASAKQTFQPTNQPSAPMPVDNPAVIYGGDPFWGFGDVISFGSGRNFRTSHNGMSGGAAGMRRR